MKTMMSVLLIGLSLNTMAFSLGDFIKDELKKDATCTYELEIHSSFRAGVSNVSKSAKTINQACALAESACRKKGHKTVKGFDKFSCTKITDARGIADNINDILEDGDIDIRSEKEYSCDIENGCKVVYGSRRCGDYVMSTWAYNEKEAQEATLDAISKQGFRTYSTITCTLN